MAPSTSLAFLATTARNWSPSSVLHDSPYVSDPSPVRYHEKASDDVEEIVNDKDGQAITLRSSSRADYNWKEVWVDICQICAVTHALSNVKQKEKDALYQSFLDHGFDYSTGTVNVTLVPSVCTLDSFDDVIGEGMVVLFGARVPHVE